MPKYFKRGKVNVWPERDSSQWPWDYKSCACFRVNNKNFNTTLIVDIRSLAYNAYKNWGWCCYSHHYWEYQPSSDTFWGAVKKTETSSKNMVRSRYCCEKLCCCVNLVDKPKLVCSIFVNVIALIKETLKTLTISILMSILVLTFILSLCITISILFY